MTPIIRAAHPPTDFAQIAEILTAVEPEPVTAADLHEDEQRLVAGKLRRRFVATAGDHEIVGYALAVHYPSQGAGVFHIQVVVAPAHQRQGIGAALYDQALAFVRKHGATLLYCEVQERFPAALRFAERRGFAVHQHETAAVLDLATFDEAPWQSHLDAIRQRGIRISTFAALGQTPENERRLYAINRIATTDNPTTDGTFPSFEVWRKLIVEASDFQPEGQIVAFDMHRPDETLIGLSGISYSAATNTAGTLLTGVAASYRGQGIGLALKLHAIRFARTRGATHILTTVNVRNTPMLAINDKLGFQRAPGYYELRQRLEP